MINTNAHNKVNLMVNKDDARFEIGVIFNVTQRQLPTSSPKEKVGSPNGCESNINNSRKIDLKDNNKQTSTVAAPPKTDIQRLSTANCYFATQAVKLPRGGY